MLLPNEPWIGQALCAQTDPEAFFPEKGGSTRAAKAICRTCPVRAQCLDFALTIEASDSRIYRHGIYGGLSPAERQRLAPAPVCHYCGAAFTRTRSDPYRYCSHAFAAAAKQRTAS